jgi:hypothetical protein|tara:strand:+ start:255 stop:485 length:231 start_codon:yes stop_codon:yes gene_type:complete
LALIVSFDNKNRKYQVIFAQSSLAHEAAAKFVAAHTAHTACGVFSTEVKIGHGLMNLFSVIEAQCFASLTKQDLPR